MAEHSLLIVEDENIIRDGLVGSIPWHEYGFRVIGAASDGEEAMTIIRETAPEAVITDIKMPRTDGLQLLGCIRRVAPKTEVVILSGYEEFEYAREGLKKGAFAYILKLELKRELPGVFRDLCLKLDEREVRRAREVEFRRIELDHKLRQLEKGGANELIEGTGVRAFAVVPTEDEDPAATGVVERLVDDGFVCHLVGTDLIVALLSGRDAAELKTHAARLSSLVGREEDASPCALGAQIVDPSGPVESFRQARKALDFAIRREMSGVISYDEIERRLLPGQTLGDWRQIGRMVLVAHSAEIEERIDAEFDRAIRSANIGLPDLRLRIESMLALVCGSLPPEAHEIRTRVAEIASRVESWPLMSSLQEWLTETLLEISEEIAALRASPVGEKIDKARDLIDRNFATDVLLEDVAEYVFLSPSYFAARFKESAGTTFSNYLRERRLNEAMKLLRGSDLRLREIAEAVGYTDVKYFMRVFKQHTGLTANEYRTRQTESNREE